MTSNPDFTSHSHERKPYWTPSCLDISKRWLSISQIGCPTSDLTSTNMLLANTVSRSWFSTTLSSSLRPDLFATQFPSHTFREAEWTATEQTVTRAKKQRIYPKPDSLERMKQYLGLTRHWYNTAIAYLRQDGTSASLQEVRKLQAQKHPDWAFDCPQRIREHALADAVRAIKNAKMKCLQTGQFQEVSHRSRFEAKQSFGFDAKSLDEQLNLQGKTQKKQQIKPFREAHQQKQLELAEFRRKKDEIQEMLLDCEELREHFLFNEKAHRVFFTPSERPRAELEGVRVVRENGRWFLILPEIRQVYRPENQRLPLVALDPGVRTFVTFYSPHVHGKLGDGDFQRIYRLCLHLDRLLSKQALATGKRRYRLKKAIWRMRWKIRDLVDELHHKVAYFLVSRFERILLPRFETSQMVTKLQSKTARAMLTWAHYRFKQALKSKAEEYDAEIIEVNEAYTSKTCSYCGTIQHIGSKKVMRCRCGVSVDRDLNGARGIMLRALVATPSLLAYV